MNSGDHILASCLTYGGTIPLIAAAVQALCGNSSWVEPLPVAVTYSAMILSFLAGMHWASYLFFAKRCPLNLLITSNIVALLSWLSLLVPAHAAVWLDGLCFLMMLALDRLLMKREIFPHWFFLLRRNATLIVVICLGVVGGGVYEKAHCHYRSRHHGLDLSACTP